MSKLITSALLATVLLTGGFQTAANAQSADETYGYVSGGDRTDKSDREYVCKELQRNCS
jgi:hypothetical protein